MIRIRPGIKLRIKETITLLAIITNNTAIDITKAGFSCTVIVKVEQIPSPCTEIGLLSFNGSVNKA